MSRHKEGAFDLITAAMVPAPSIRTLCRPVKEDALPSSAELCQKVKALMLAIEYGDQETRTAAEMLAYRMLFEAMAARMNNPERGAIPRFVNQLSKSVKAFEDVLR